MFYVMCVAFRRTIYHMRLTCAVTYFYTYVYAWTIMIRGCAFNTFSLLDRRVLHILVTYTRVCVLRETDDGLIVIADACPVKSLTYFVS